MKGKYHKPANMKYTDMCIFIDQHMPETVNNGEYPYIESKIFEYLYHIIYALACKQNFFKNFDDYDTFSMYGASELFLSMRNKQRNAGKIVRGKEVVPVKSCLNFIKSVLFPLKVNYQRNSFASILNPELNQSTDRIEETIKANVRSNYSFSLEDDLNDMSNQLPSIVRKVIKETPYRLDPLMCSRLTISCMLTFINDVTLSGTKRNKVRSLTDPSKDGKVYNIYKNNTSKVIL